MKWRSFAGSSAGEDGTSWRLSGSPRGRRSV